MTTSAPKDSPALPISILNTMKAVSTLQQNFHQIEARPQKVEEDSKILNEQQRKMNDKVESFLDFYRIGILGVTFAVLKTPRGKTTLLPHHHHKQPNSYTLQMT
jgi:hypothetical protein